MRRMYRRGVGFAPGFACTRREGSVLAALLLCGCLAWAEGGSTAHAGTATPGVTPPTKAYALVIGVNRAPDHTVTPLRYADDDAVRFGDLFRTVGVQTTVLATLDQNTRRLHPDAASEATAARLETLTSTVEELARDTARARAAGYRVTFYFVYAGHGRVDGETGAGSISLEDAQLGGGDILSRIIDRVAADENHVIVDACNSYFLVLGRGPGGRRRPIDGFAQLGALAGRADVGLVLSTSSARDSHEWAAFQSGVFSHEVRSGLYGAADGNSDGLVTYGELGAFVVAANAAIRNERYRPELYSRPPAGAGTLLDVRAALARRIEVPPGGGHQFLEDTSGVRLADFHNGTLVRLVRPADGRLYLRRTSDDREYVLPSKVPVLHTAELALQEPRSSTRSAANDAFASLFASPFGGDQGVQNSAGETQREGASPVAVRHEGRTAFRLRPMAMVGAGLAAVGAGGVVWGLATLLEARNLGEQPVDHLTGEAGGAVNARIESGNRRGALLVGGGAAMIASGLLVLLWPETPVNVAVTEHVLGATLRSRF